MSSRPNFEPEAATRSLQEAVRIHDRARLDELVSDRLLFVTGRSLGRRGKAEWIDAAMQVDWRDFDLAVVRTLDLGDVIVVEHEIAQEIETLPSWATEEAPTRSAWITTDIWTVEDGMWRLAVRHPEMASLDRS